MENSRENADVKNTAAFFSFINQRRKFRLYLLNNLPAAYFSGLQIINAGADSCTVSVPFKWFTKNPFRSTYFACLSMAAEMSTGLLAMAYVYKRKPAVSMLITGLEAKFYKKAKGLAFFSCNDGEAIRLTIETAVTSGNGQQIKALAVGKNESGETIAEFWVTWSFKAK